MTQDISTQASLPTLIVSSMLKKTHNPRPEGVQAGYSKKKRRDSYLEIMSK